MVKATTASGTATASSSFTYVTPPAPTITSFTPTEGLTGGTTMVTITGTGLSGRPPSSSGDNSQELRRDKFDRAEGHNQTTSRRDSDDQGHHAWRLGHDVERVHLRGADHQIFVVLTHDRCHDRWNNRRHLGTVFSGQTAHVNSVKFGSTPAASYTAYSSATITTKPKPRQSV